MVKIDRIRSFTLVAVSVGLILVLILGSVVPAKAAEPGRVKIGFTAVLTGAIATTGVCMSEGVIDSIRHTNEQGGIDGISVDLLWEDVQVSVARVLTAHKRWKAAGVVAEIHIISTPAETVLPDLQKSEIPMIFEVGFTEGLITRPIRWCFAASAGLAAEFVGFMEWVTANWTQEHPPRIGVIYYDDRAGWDFFGGAKYADDIGVEVVGHEVVPLLGCIDTSVEWLRLAAKEPDFIYIFSSGSTTVTLVKDAIRLGVRDKGITLASWTSLDASVLKAIGRDSEGWYTFRFFPASTQTDLLGMQTVLEAAKRYRGDDPEKVSGNYIGMWAIAKITVEAIRMAIERVGFENLTGRAVRDALASMEGFDTGLLPPITMSDGRPFFTPGIRPYIIREFTREGECIGDWIEWNEMVTKDLFGS